MPKFNTAINVNWLFIINKTSLYRMMIKDIMINSNNHDHFQRLCNGIFTISPNIRFVGIIDKVGRLVAGGMRKDMESMERKEDSPKLYIEFVLRTEMRKDFDVEFGKTIYNYSEREKIKLVSFPLNNHLLRVSIEKKEPDHKKIIENILNVIKNEK
jgi:hypothetical protein